jgi:uncharacterized protein (DUF488 family)
MNALEPDGISIYTLGHSNLEPAEFLEALRRHAIVVLADVRSAPRSSRHPQFSRDNLEPAVREAGMDYKFLGEELGGRPADPKLYSANGVVDYRARRQCRDFQGGIERVIELAQRGPLALLCAEEDPITCHRFLLITPELVLRGLAPRHIRRGATLESQQQAEDRLLATHQMGAFAGNSLFPADRTTALEDALQAQAEKCAFRADPLALEYSQY